MLEVEWCGLRAFPQPPPPPTAAAAVKVDGDVGGPTVSCVGVFRRCGKEDGEGDGRGGGHQTRGRRVEQCVPRRKGKKFATRKGNWRLREGRSALLLELACFLLSSTGCHFPPSARRNGAEL
jgi:hypothetical protein